MNKTPEEKAQSYDYIEKVATLISRVRRGADRLFRPKDEDEEEFYPLVGADFPPGDGVRVFWRGIEHPTKTFPYKETLEKIDDIKKVAKVNLWSFLDIFQANPIKALLLLFFTKDIERGFLNLLSELDQILRDIRNQPAMFCQAVRELWRVFELEEGETRQKIKELFCHIMEYDDTYRYRVQYILAKLDKFALIKNPVKELRRLLDILIKAEVQSGLDRKWRILKKAIWFLRFKPKLKKEIVKFLINVNLAEIKLDEIDKFHARKKYGIKWDF